MKGTTFKLMRSPAFALASVPLLLTAVAAQAAWEMVPDISTYADNDDNVLLSPNAATQVDASRMAMDAAVRATNYTERGSLYVEPRYIADAYSGEENQQFERDDYFVESGGNYRWRSASAGFQFLYSNQIILSSEFADVVEDPSGGFDDPDTGRIEFFEERQERVAASGNYAFRISERNQLRFDLVYQDVAYTGQETPRRSDFDSTGAYISIVRNIDERNRVTARLSVNEFYAVSNQNTTLNVGVEGSFTRSLGPTWSLDVSAGARRSEYDYLRLVEPIPIREENAAMNPTYGIGITKTGERGRWNASMRRLVQANANGFVVVRDDFNTTYTRRMSERLTARIGARLNITEAVDELRQQDDRNYARLVLGVEWAFRPTILLIGGFNSVNQDFVNDPNPSAQSNSVHIGVTYRGRSRQN